MRVFVVGTGRCGSVTFSKACRHLDGFTVGHESPVGRELAFPDQHVEVSPRLTWVLPVLVQKYRHDVLYVHLRRKREEVIASWLRRGRRRGPGIWERLVNDSSINSYRQICELCYDSMIATIDLALVGTNHLTLWLHHAQESWIEFWTAIRAKGDYQRSLAEWNVRYNRSKT